MASCFFMLQHQIVLAQLMHVLTWASFLCRQSARIFVAFTILAVAANFPLRALGHSWRGWLDTRAVGLQCIIYEVATKVLAASDFACSRAPLPPSPSFTIIAFSQDELV
uniref:Uncharacterized protein n=1 Tax=Eutreptiella gymnastica TaxID=73025 RepID=A0A7S1ISF0_9EUGL